MQIINDGFDLFIAKVTLKRGHDAQSVLLGQWNEQRRPLRAPRLEGVAAEKFLRGLEGFY